MSWPLSRGMDFRLSGWGYRGLQGLCVRTKSDIFLTQERLVRGGVARILPELYTKGRPVRGYHTNFKVARFGAFPSAKLPCLGIEDVSFCPYKTLGHCDGKNRRKELEGFALLCTALVAFL